MSARALLTDMYQLTMLQAYFEAGMNEEAVFEFFVRRLPARRNFLLAAGLDQALEYLEGLAFTEDELDWLACSGHFSRPFVESLAGLHFTGSVEAMAEGTVCFANEPLLRVTAPLREAQLVETRLINLLQFQTLVASKAVRCRLAAPGRQLVEFGLRRAHGAEAGLLAARAAYLAGFDGTSDLLAGMRWGIPVFGTMAHSFVQAHADEVAAFRHFARSQPQGATLLIDTYDTDAAAAALVPLAHTLARQGLHVRGVRLDSGDLGAQAGRLRHLFDAAGLPGLQIFASGDLDELALRALSRAHAPIDGYGVGTRLVTCADQPWLDCAYKLQEYAGRPVRKRSTGKATWPGRKQVFRRHGAGEVLMGDRVTLESEQAEGTPLLHPVMRHGRRLAASVPLISLRERVLAQLATLPEPLRGLDPAPPYPVTIAPGVQALARAVDAASRRPGAVLA